MSASNSIEIAKWVERSNELLLKIRNVYFEFGINTESLPEDAFEGDKKISLVFAGQYSAGKSTILKALTGINDIVVKEGIATQETHEYDWSGMTVIDTPGIGTKLRPDHDEIAMKAIAQADMLVYVVTHNLFDDQIGKEFRKLIITNDKAKETILVINKMAEVGNNIETRRIMTDALKNVTDPYLPESLHLCFVDAESYVDSISEEDPEIADELIERSNYSGLVKTINKVVDERALSVKLTTALYRTLDSIQESVTQFLPSSGDDDIDSFEETQLRQKSILAKVIKNIDADVKARYREASSQIRDIGRDLANSLDSYSEQSEVDDAFKNAQNEVDTISQQCSQNIEQVIEENLAEYNVEMEEFYNSPFTQHLYQRMKTKNYNDMPVIKKIVESEVLSKGGMAIINNAGGAQVGLKGLAGFKGTNIHQIVLDVGHFFGHSFKPWEAVKITKGINVAGRVIGVAGTVLSVFMQAKEDYDADQRVKEQRQAREQIRGAYNSAAEELEMHFSESLNNLIETNLRPRLEEIDSSINSIRTLRTGKSEKCDRLMQLDSDCRKLIGEIHSVTN